MLTIEELQEELRCKDMKIQELTSAVKVAESKGQHLQTEALSDADKFGREANELRVKCERMEKVIEYARVFVFCDNHSPQSCQAAMSDLEIALHELDKADDR